MGKEGWQKHQRRFLGKLKKRFEKEKGERSRRQKA